MRRRVSRRMATVALVVYSGLLAVLYRNLHEPIGLKMIALFIAVGVCLSALATFIAQSEPPK